MSAADPALPGVFGALAPVLDAYGYLAVGGFVLLEDFGVPVPGETILVAGAVYAGAGRLSLVGVAVVAFVAAVVGDSIGYGIGRHAGRRLVLRYGRYVLITRERLDHAERAVRRHGAWIVAIARFVEGLRQANGIVAGIADMGWARRFLPANVAGAALWVGTWVTVGFLAGAHLDVLYAQLTRYGGYLAAGLGVLVVVLAGRALLQRHRRREAGTG